MNIMTYKLKNTLRFIYNFARLRNKNISWKILRYQQYVIEVEIDENVKTQFRVYRNTKKGYKLSTKQIFRSVEGAKNFIDKVIQRSANLIILQKKRLNKYILF